MEKMIIAAKIDVTKIAKDRLFEGKNGAKYLDIVLIETPDGKWGNDFMLTQQVSQEERAQNIRGAILGNGKFIRGKPGEAQPQGSRRPDTRPAKPMEDARPADAGEPPDDLPF